MGDGRSSACAALLALLTLPLTLKAINGAWQSHDRSRLISAMGVHVVVVLLNQVLIALGYIIA